MKIFIEKLFIKFVGKLFTKSFVVDLSTKYFVNNSILNEKLFNEYFCR